MQATLRMILYVTAIAVGVLAMVFSLSPAARDSIVAALAQPTAPLACGALAIVLLATPVALALRWYQVWRRARDISYTGDNGRISVSLIAIEEALTRAVEGEPEVRKALVKVFEDRVKRAVVIDAVVSLWEVPNVTERNRFLSRLLRRRFAELMPEQTVVLVNLTIHRLYVRRVEAKQPAVKPPTTATAASERIATPTPPRPAPDLSRLDEELYVGPSYPVLRDDDDDATGGGTQAYAARPVPPANTPQPTPR
jgi:hypothetical protein